MTTTTKKTETQTQTAFKMWEDYTKSYSDMIVEITQRSFDQSIAMSEQIAGIWTDAAKKTQAMLVKETETALKLVEEAQAQIKTSSDQVVKMAQDFSTN